jgi:hypothetical protein
MIDVWTKYGEHRLYGNGETDLIQKFTIVKTVITATGKAMPISTSAIFVTGETKPAHAWKKKRPFATVALKPISKN